MADVITDLETAILERLRAAIPATDYKVDRFPEKPAEYRLYHSKGALLLAYSGSRYTDEDDSLNLRTMQWVVTLLVKGIQTHHAAYPLLSEVIAALDGWTPPSGRKMRIQYDRFITENGGVWQYDILFHLDRTHIAGHNCLADTTN